MGNKLPKTMGKSSKPAGTSNSQPSSRRTSLLGSRRTSQNEAPVPNIETPRGMEASEVKTLWQLFNTISQNGLVSRSAFAEACDYQNDQMRERAFVAFDSNADGSISFSEFLSGMNFLNSKAPVTEKIPFLFRAYDWDGDGKLSFQDIYNMLLANGAENGLVITPSQANDIVAFTFEELAPASSDFITFEEFERMVQSKPRLVASTGINATKSFGKILVMGSALGDNEEP